MGALLDLLNISFHRRLERVETRASGMGAVMAYEIPFCSQRAPRVCSEIHLRTRSAYRSRESDARCIWCVFYFRQGKRAYYGANVSRLLPKSLETSSVVSTSWRISDFMSRIALRRLSFCVCKICQDEPYPSELMRFLTGSMQNIGTHIFVNVFLIVEFPVEIARTWFFGV